MTARRYPSIADPMPGRPALETAWNEGPGPLSPVWPKPQVVTPPINEWAEMSAAFSALRRACWASLRPELHAGPFMLSFDERAELDDCLRRIRIANAEMTPAWRMRDVDAWPDPVLPANVLFGARDLAEVLGKAIAAANKLARYVALDIPALTARLDALAS